MPTMFLVFNHEITELQESDARKTLGIGRFVAMPPMLKEIWQNIPAQLTAIEAYIQPVKTWLKQNALKSDYVLVQGDFGATYSIVRYAFENDLIPVYSTTERNAVETRDVEGFIKMVHQIKHCLFRKYGV